MLALNWTRLACMVRKLYYHDFGKIKASSALMLATRGNHIKIVEVLMAREPNLNTVDYNGLSALGIAAREGYKILLNLLIVAKDIPKLLECYFNQAPL